MSSFLIPHPEATIEDLHKAVVGWREAAAAERFRAENNLCAGWPGVALHNAELYEKTAKELEEQLQKMERMAIH